MTAVVSGFFGKLPARGDFVERRLSRAFVEGWDGWLQRAIASSQQELADTWLDTYLTSPVWTFASSAGVFGPSACIGIYMPSVDKVGRYYPMTIALELPEAQSPWSILCGAQTWAAQAEQVLFSLLSEEVVELTTFDDAVAALPYPGTAHEEEAPQRDDDSNFAGPIQFALADAGSVAQLGGELADTLGSMQSGPHTLWCSPGSELVAPSLLVVENTPHETVFPALLDGQWLEHGWLTRDLTNSISPADVPLAELDISSPHEALSLTADLLDSPVALDSSSLDIGLEAVEAGSLDIEELGIFSTDEPGAALDELGQTAEHPVVTLPSQDTPGAPGIEAVMPASAYQVRSGSVTNKGNVRASNQDACFGADHLRSWIVADGVGGHGAGELASALAVRVLEELVFTGDLAARALTLQGGMRLVEQALLAIGTRYGDLERSATTVVALLHDADQVALCWAGDSRIYRIRDQKLAQLTEDHSAPEIEGVDQSNVITRAVGGEDPVELELRYESLRPGDRFLLCSDGVYRELGDEELTELVASGHPQECCDELQERILATPAADNFTALVVEFSA